MKRIADLPTHILENLSQFFGDDPSLPRWRDVYDAALRAGASTGDALLRYYQSQLRVLGYQFSDFASIKMNVVSGVPLYQMLFASRDPRGGDIWNKALAKTSNGQRRLLF